VFVLKQEFAIKRELAVSTCDRHGSAMAGIHLELESVVPVLRPEDPVRQDLHSAAA
jgi:hypothetical protein